MDVYATFMHPYKRCLKYTNSFIRVLGGTHSGVYFFVNIKNINLAAARSIFFIRIYALHKHK